MERKSVGSCCVRHLHPATTESDLFLLFSQIHPVHSVRVVTDPLTNDPRGYGFVNFAHDHGHFPAEEATSRLNGSLLRGQPITVTAAERDVERRRRFEGNVFVKGLDTEIDSQTLHDTFDIFGQVVSAKVACGLDGRSLGYGYVQFLRDASAEEAVKKANNMMLKHRTITVERFKPRHERRNEHYTNIFVKQLPSHVQSQEQLAAMFESYGIITSVYLPMVHGKAKGFGFVNFEKPGSAKQATNEMHDKEIDGKRLYVQRAQTKTERRRYLEQRYRENKRMRDREIKGRNLYVKNFPIETKDDDLFQLFSRFGTITSAKVMCENGRSRGFGFVCFSTPNEAGIALEAMNGYLFARNKRLYVNVAQSFEERKHLLQRLKTGMPFQTMYPHQSPFYPPTLPVPPILSTVSPALEYTQMQSMFPSMAFPVPAMAPPTMIPPNNDSYKHESKLQHEGWWVSENRSGRRRHDALNDPELVEIGYTLYGMVFKEQPNQALAQKITGMLLDLGINKARSFVSNEKHLHQWIEESVTVLERAGYFTESPAHRSSSETEARPASNEP